MKSLLSVPSSSSIAECPIESCLPNPVVDLRIAKAGGVLKSGPAVTMIKIGGNVMICTILSFNKEFSPYCTKDSDSCIVIEILFLINNVRCGTNLYSPEYGLVIE